MKISTSYSLRDHGYPWKVITAGRQSVGRVWQHAGTGRWHGEIGTHRGEGATPREAFEAVAARALGFSDPHHLKASNDRVRRHRASARQQARALVADMMSSHRETREAAYDRLLKVL